MRLLSLALRALTVVEPMVRVALNAAGKGLRGLSAGKPQRETARSTTERLLRAFREIILSVVRLPDQTVRHVPPLSPLQRRILDLVAPPASIYENLALPFEPIPP